MSALTPRPRTRRSDAIQLACEAAIWLGNLYQIATQFHAMSFMMAATAGMIFLLVPATMWQAMDKLRKETA